MNIHEVFQFLLHFSKFERRFESCLLSVVSQSRLISIFNFDFALCLSHVPDDLVEIFTL